MNSIQFQLGMELFEYFQHFDTDTRCTAAMERNRRPDGFRCPSCAASCHPSGSTHKNFRSNAYLHQTSLIAGTVFEGIKLGMTVWFLAICLIGAAKTGLSAGTRKSHLWVSYQIAWLIYPELMQAMLER